LVDSTWEPVREDFEDQADLCEIIRAATVRNIFAIKDLDMRNIPISIIDKIDCAGPIWDNDGPKICAATSSSHFNNQAWTIFLKSSVIQFAWKPNFSKKWTANNEVERDQFNVRDIFKQSSVVWSLLKFSKSQVASQWWMIAKMLQKAEETHTKTTMMNMMKWVMSSTVISNVASWAVDLQSNSWFSQLWLKPRPLLLKKPSSVVWFYMISYKFWENETLKMKYRLWD